MTEPHPAQRTQLPVKIGFGAGDFAFNLLWTGTSLFLLFFYTDVMGLPPFQAGLVYFLAMAWDAVSDPIMGGLADRTRSRWGRYRPYLLFGAAPLALSYPLVYWSAGLEGVGLFAWALLTHCVFRTCYTVVSIPYTALQARLTSDSDERGSLAAWRVIGAALGGFAVALSTTALAGAFGGGERGWVFAAGVFGAACMVLLWACFLAVREPVEILEKQDAVSTSLWVDLGSFLALVRVNGPLIQILLVVVIGSIAATMFVKNILYYFKYNLNAEEWGAVAVVIPAAMMFIGVPFWTWISRLISKRNTLILCCAIGAATYLAFYLNPSLAPEASLAIMVLMGLATAGNGVMFWAILPDTIEYGEARTGHRHEAKVFGLAMFAMKAALGVNAVLLGWLLQQTGYVANQPQSLQTLAGIKAIMTLIPLAGVLACIVVLWRYPIDARYHADLRAQIAERQAAGHG